jgi:putative transcriptional regulator
MSDESIAPVLLVAMPQLQDPNFHRAVVLLVEHSNEGALGLVLNREGDLKLAELCKSLEIRWAGDPNAVTDWGGPVQPNKGWMLFSTPPDPTDDDDDDDVDDDGDTPAQLSAAALSNDEEDDDDAQELLEGVYVGVTLDTLRDVAEHAPAHFRLFLGYAGWGPGQLEREMAQGDWIIAPARAECIFGAPNEELWTRVIDSLGVDPTHLIATPGIH